MNFWNNEFDTENIIKDANQYILVINDIEVSVVRDKAYYSTVLKENYYRQILFHPNIIEIYNKTDDPVTQVCVFTLNLQLGNIFISNCDI